MTSRDLKSNVDASQSIAPQALTGEANGTGADTREFDSAMVVFHFGACADGTFTPVLEESDSLGSGYTSVAAADQQGTLAAVSNGVNENADQRVGYIGNKRFIRATIEESGSSTGCLAGATIHRGHPHGAPAA